MSSRELTDEQVAFAIKQFGNYRTRRCQAAALEGPPDGIYGITLMGLGLRETGLRNINGGATWDGHQWVPNKTDRGVFQIASLYHSADLARMPGVQAGTWAPVVAGNASADTTCPRFEDSLQFTLRQMHEAQAYANDHGVPNEDLPRFAVVAHNAGIGGALKGYHEGEWDKYTALGDYSQWVLVHAKKIKAWLAEHPHWRYSQPTTDPARASDPRERIMPLPTRPGQTQ